MEPFGRSLVLTLAIVACWTPAMACWTSECVEFIDQAMARHRLETQKPPKVEPQPPDAQKAQTDQLRPPEPRATAPLLLCGHDCGALPPPKL
jgi:hypothetical protein